jgi:Lon protease-like protein
MGELIPLFPLSTPLFPGIVLPLQIFEPRYRRLMADLLALPEGSGRRFFGVTAIRQGWEVERIAPAEALYDIGCTARLRAVRREPDGGFRIVTVGGDRFRLLDVVVGNEDAGDPPYLRAEVEWLADEEAAEDEAAAQDGLPQVGGEDVAAAVARGSMDVLVRSLRNLFIRYVTEVAALRLGWDDTGGDPDALADAVSERDFPEDDDDAERVGARTAALLGAVADDPRGLSYLVASAALLTPEDRQALLAVSATRRRLAAESRLLRRELTVLQTLGAVPVPLREFPAPTAVN